MNNLVDNLGRNSIPEMRQFVPYCGSEALDRMCSEVEFAQQMKFSANKTDLLKPKSAASARSSRVTISMRQPASSSQDAPHPSRLARPSTAP
jgi:hypothetical protein